MRFLSSAACAILLSGAVDASRAQAQDVLAAPLPNPVAAPTAPIQGTYHLTLEEAKQRALDTSKGLVLGNLGVQEKREATAAARTDYLPKLLGNVSYFHFNDDLGTVNTIGRGRLGVIPPSARTIAVNAINQDSVFTTVMLAQPITKLIAVNAAVKLARADEEIAQAQLDQGMRDLLSGVAQAFYGLHGAQRLAEALRLQIDYVDQVARMSGAPDARIAAIEAKQALNQVQGQSADIAEQLVNLVGLPAGTILVLVDPMPPEPTIHSADEAAARAMACNPQIREATATTQRAEAGLQVARADFLPDVNIFGAYFNQNALPIIQDNFGAFGVTASYTFVDWGKRRHVKRQRLFQVSQAHKNVQDVIDKVVLQARQAYASFERSDQALDLAGEMVEARHAAEAQAKEPPALQAAKAATAKAELERLQAEAEYRVAHAKLMNVVGGE